MPKRFCSDGFLLTPAALSLVSFNLGKARVFGGICASEICNNAFESMLADSQRQII